MSRSRCAACSGASGVRPTPVPSSRPPALGAEGSSSMRQQKCSASRGAVRTQRLNGGRGAEGAFEPSDHVVEKRRAEWALVLESSPGLSRRDRHLERHAPGERAEGNRLAVDRHDAVAEADLFLDQVLQQVAPVGAERVGGESLAFACYQSGDEGERVELGAGLVGRHVHVGAALREPAFARARDPSRPVRPSTPTGGPSPTTSWAPEAGLVANMSGSPRPDSSGIASELGIASEHGRGLRRESPSTP